ncbi:MAG: hypothetical protein ACAH12_01060 [Methylophilaceae bacterium]|uniref:hypothetical protein n=1 Tax=Methylovorus sp. MM2 TaxID=1848038 RepID=UPI0007E075D6|nr:hypothetical protein [Methylovorus sp. MM2]OAM52116.1 hypothetical protein A7981_01100 [Methylovorus sp. MM2]
MKLITLILCLSLVLIACSQDKDATPKIAEGPRAVLEKAKTVDATVQQSAEETKRQIDATTE